MVPLTASCIRTGQPSAVILTSISTILCQERSILCVDPWDQRAPSIYEDKIVWQDGRKGKFDIYGYDLKADSESGICNATGDRRNPSIWRTIVIWEDWRNDRSDVYAYDLLSVHELPIATAGAFKYNPVVYGNTLAFDDGDVYSNSTAIGR